MIGADTDFAVVIAQSVFMERVKNDADRLIAEVREEFGGVGPEEWKFPEPIKTCLDGSIALASVSHDGRVIANTFEMRFPGTSPKLPSAEGAWF
eukprot:683142-Rhodomonas_salina.7